MADTDKQKRRKGTLAGLGLIALGAIGALVSYISDSHSFDAFKHIYAGDLAMLHLVLWTVGGLCVIAWYNRPPDDQPPFEPRDDNRDGVR